MKTLLVFLGFFSIVVANQAVACSASGPTAEEARKFSDVVFVGRAMKIQHMGSKDSGDPGIILDFAVSSSWKGTIGESLTLYTLDYVRPCDSEKFKVGEIYLIYAKKLKAKDWLDRISPTALKQVLPLPF